MADWVRLGDVCTISGINEQLNFSEEYWLLNLDMVEKQTGRILTYQYVSAEALEGSIIGFDTNNVLYSKLRPNLNKVVLPDCCGYATSEMVPLKPDAKVLSREYLAEYLRSDVFVKWAISKTTGAKMPRLGKKELLNKKIPLPSLSEQKKISALLKKISDLIGWRQQQLVNLDELVKSRFIEMFGDPTRNNKRWAQKSLGEITTKIGSGATPRGGKGAYKEDGVALIRSMNVHNGLFDYKELAHISDEQASKLDNVKIEENDILLNITGASVARSCVVPSKIIPARVNQHVCIIRCKDCIIPIFLNKLLIDDNFQALLWSIATGGATREAITKQQVERLQIILPPLDLQNQFADFVAQVDKSKLAVQKSLEQLEILKKALMQEYFG